MWLFILVRLYNTRLVKFVYTPLQYSFYRLVEYSSNSPSQSLHEHSHTLHVSVTFGFWHQRPTPPVTISQSPFRAFGSARQYRCPQTYHQHPEVPTTKRTAISFTKREEG